MKNIVTLFLTLLLSLQLYSQKKPPTAAFKWAPAALVLGNVSLQGEYSFGRKSLTAKIGVPVLTTHTLKYDDRDAIFRLKASTFLAGYRSYLSKKSMKGIYLEPFFKYVHLSGEGEGKALVNGNTVRMNFSNQYNGAGFGLQMGAQFIVANRIVIDLFLLGPEMNLARNTFKGKENSSYLPWTSIDGKDVEKDIREFIDKFPFIRKRTNILIDEKNKTVTANFKGLLPGFRTGVSFGVVF